MPRRVPLPSSLAGIPFTVAAGRAAGLGDGRMRGPDLARPFRGVRTAGAPATVVELCRAYLLRLRPGEYFSHTTAAALWGCPLPARSSPRGPLHVSGTGRAARGPQVIGHQVTDPAVRVVLRYGLPVADAASVFRQLGQHLSLDDLVVVGDHLVLDPAVLDPYDPRPYASIDQLRRRSAGSYRGARTAKAAVDLVRVGAESPRETLLRLLLQRAGLPEPELNLEIDGVKRRWRHRADIVYRTWKVIAEYDGDQHRTDTVQYERDIRRFDDFSSDDWRVIRVRKRGISITPEDTVRRVTDALRERGWDPGLPA